MRKALPGKNTIRRRIALVPPYSERFEKGEAGAFSLFIAETSEFSRFAADLAVFGRPVREPFMNFNHLPIEPEGPIWLSKNRRVAWRIAKELRLDPPDLIEVFNRPEMFEVMGRMLPSTPIVLHLGNDPQQMRRGRSRRVRQRILDRAAGVWGCSRYVCERFSENLVGPTERIRPLYAGSNRSPDRPEKEPLVLYVGRIIEEKGVLELAEALAGLLPGRTNWRAEFVGANRPGKGGQLTPYERSVHARLAGLGSQVTFRGFLAADAVMALMRRAAILVVPSKWQEPMGRTAIEGLAAGCAVVASRRGGLPELVENRGLIIDDISANGLTRALEPLLSDRAQLKVLQDRAWVDFPFELGHFVQRYDDWREEAMSWGPCEA